jgi:lipopolysaccharide export system permease protein
MKKTVTLYILKEIFPVFLIGLMTFTIILLMDKIFKIIELIVTRGVKLSHILMLLLYISPSFLIFTLPMAFLLGTLLAFGRLSQDSEITALKASGLSLYQLYLPVLLFSLGTYLLTSFLVFYGLPWGNRGFKSTLFLIAQSKADVEIKERVFNDVFEGFVIYVDKVPIQGKKMEGILIYDEREKEKTNTIFAKEGFLFNNPNSQELLLNLRHGDIHRFEPRTQVYQKMHFESYDLRLELSKTFGNLGKKLKEHEMSVEELRERMEKKRWMGEDITPQEVELHKRYAIPFSCFVFGLIAVPLGIYPRRSGRSYGFVLSILIILAYYIALTASEILAMRKDLPPFWAGWMPNIFFGGFGIFLLVKAAKESPFKPLLWIAEKIQRIQEKGEGGIGDV